MARLLKIGVGFLLQASEFVQEALGGRSQGHAFFRGVAFHKFDAQAVFRSPQAAPGGAVGHAELFCRRIEAAAFVDGLEQLFPAMPEDYFPLFFDPDLILDLHAHAPLDLS
jgi:hypothetical protein